MHGIPGTDYGLESLDWQLCKPETAYLDKRVQRQLNFSEARKGRLVHPTCSHCENSWTALESVLSHSLYKLAKMILFIKFVSRFSRGFYTPT